MKKLKLVIVMMSFSLIAYAQFENKLEKFDAEWIQQLRDDCYRMEFDNFKQQEQYRDLFSSKDGQEALIGIYDYYANIKLGLWNVKDKSTDFLVSETKEELTIIVNTTLERNITKDERKSIKGKASKESYKSSKYHQTGTMKYTLLIKLVDNTPKVVSVVEANILHIIR